MGAIKDLRVEKKLTQREVAEAVLMKRETENVEFKSQFTESICEEVIVFAKTNGVVVYVGVDNDGNEIGLNDFDAEKEICELLGVKKTRAYTIAKQLRDLGLIEAVGRGASKYYIRR